MNLHIFPNPEELGQTAAAHIAHLSAEAVAARGCFTVALSGGSLPQLLGPALVRQAIEWTAWRVFWADERCVPLTHPDSNYNLARQYLFDHAPIPPGQIHPPDTSLDPAQTAVAYQSTLTRLLASSPPRFDLILLGLGEDGHTASLFPGHPLLQETGRWVAPIFDSPKPPPQRVTLTLPTLNHARQVIFITTGAGKAAILPQVFQADSPLPAHLVQPTSGQLHWFVDEAATTNLPKA